MEARTVGADFRGAQLWRADVGDEPDLAERWRLADLREVGVASMENVEDFIDEVSAEIEHENTREDARERLRHGLIEGEHPEAPSFPKKWRSAPNVMFDPRNPLPQQLGWGARVWATEDAYDEDLGWFLGKLACNKDASVHVVGGLARRALREDDRLYAKLLAARLTGDDCPPAAGLPDNLRERLEELAAR